MHYEVWRYYQNICKLHAKLLQGCIVTWLPARCRCNQPLSVRAEQDALQQLHQAAQLEEQAACLLQPHFAADIGHSLGGPSATPLQQSESDLQHGCQLLQQCLKLRQQLLHPQNELLGRTWQRLAAAHGMQPVADSQQQAIACCQKACEAIEYAYGRQSTAAAFQQAELAILMAPCSMGNAVTVAQAAYSVLKLHFEDNDHSAMQSLVAAFPNSFKDSRQWR